MEFMKVLFDSQSCWEAVSALGTIMASGIALWLARRDHTKNMSALLVWNRVEKYIPTLLLFNTGNIPIAVKSIKLTYRGRKIYECNTFEDTKAEGYEKYIVKPHDSNKLILNSDLLTITGVRRPNRYQKLFIPCVTIDICDVEGKRFVFRQKIADGKMGEAIFGHALFGVGK